MVFSDCNHYIKILMVDKSSGVSRSEVKRFKLFELDHGKGGGIVTMK